MASKRAAVPAKHLFNGFRAYEQQPTRQCLTRSMATEAPLPGATISKSYIDANLGSAPTEPILEDKVSVPPATPSNQTITRPNGPPVNPFLKTAQCTLYNFPSMEPVAFASYPSTHLLLPLRKDILHKAVIFEADAARGWSTANTKWRSEIHGSGRKIRPQKGTGKARLGDKKSPMLRGGGVAFGPKPRDYTTDLPKKIYDLAWRTALSYRYRMGQLVITDSEIDVPGVHEASLERYVKDVLAWNRFDKTGGKTLFVSDERRENLFSALEAKGMEKHAQAKEADWTDVKDILRDARVVIERTALERIFEEHEDDLGPQQRLGAWERMMTPRFGGSEASV